MAKKKITVKNILELMEKDDMVIVHIYAYGTTYATTWEEGIEDVEDCINRMRTDCLNAKVYRINRNWSRSMTEGVPDDKTEQWIEIHAEITQ